MSDIVDRLRDIHAGTPLDVACKLDDLCQEAATAIASLREEIERYKQLSQFKMATDLSADNASLRERVRVLEEDVSYWKDRAHDHDA